MTQQIKTLMLLHGITLRKLSDVSGIADASLSRSLKSQNVGLQTMTKVVEAINTITGETYSITIVKS